MNVHDAGVIEPWRFPERAWLPRMWLIRAIAIDLTVVAPLLPLIGP